MAAEQTEDKAPDQTSNSQAPYLKFSAREALNEGPKTSSSWSILKELKMSILDGGVSILKKGISKITGSVSGFDASQLEKKPLAQENRAPEPGRAAASSETAGSSAPVAEKSAAGKDDTSQDAQADFGGDWIDDLLAELDATDLEPATSPTSPPGAGHVTAPGTDSERPKESVAASPPAAKKPREFPGI